jgi:hypothetical protein
MIGMPSHVAHKLGLIAREVGMLSDSQAENEIDRGLILVSRLKDAGFDVVSNGEKGFPTLDQVKQKAQFIGMPEADAVEFWHHFESTGWIDKNGHPVAKWESKMVTWKIKHQEINGAKRPPSVLDLRTVIEAKEFKAAELKKNYCSESALDETWSDAIKRSEWSKLRKEVRELRNTLAAMA